MSRPRIRSIKPEHLTSEQVATLSDSAYRLWVGMIQLADDDGCGKGSGRALKIGIFAGSAASVEDVLRYRAELAAVGLVIVYDGGVHGELYALPTWRRHQVVSHRYPSAYPPPPGDAEEIRSSVPESNGSLEDSGALRSKPERSTPTRAQDPDPDPDPDLSRRGGARAREAPFLECSGIAPEPGAGGATPLDPPPPREVRSRASRSPEPEPEPEPSPEPAVAASTNGTPPGAASRDPIAERARAFEARWLAAYPAAHGGVPARIGPPERIRCELLMREWPPGRDEELWAVVERAWSGERPYWATRATTIRGLRDIAQEVAATPPAASPPRPAPDLSPEAAIAATDPMDPARIREFRRVYGLDKPRRPAEVPVAEAEAVP